MRRAIILSTLVVLLMAVAGVTVAQDRTSSPSGITTPKETTIEATEEESDETEDTISEKPKKDETTENEPDDRDESDRPDGADDRNEDNEVAAKPKKDKPVGVGESSAKKFEKSGGRKAGGKSAKKSGTGGGSKAGKVTVCHKGKKTLSVGASAEGAHVRHGDTVGACS